MPFKANNSVAPDYLLAGDSDELSLLLQQCFPIKEQPGRTAIDNATLLAMLSNPYTNSLMETVKSQLGKQQTLSAKDFATLYFVDQLFKMYDAASKVHSDIAVLIEQLRPVVARSLIRQESLAWGNKHPIQQTITSINDYALGWQPEKNRTANRYLKSLEQLLEGLISADTASELNKAGKDIQLFFNKDQRHLRKIEQRMRDTEAGLMQSRHAQKTSTLELNKKMQGKKLPAAIIQFLQTSWRDSLQLALINQENDDKQWQFMLTLTERLINSFQQIDNNKALLEDIPKITAELKTHSLSIIHDKVNLENQLSIIAAEHFKVLQGEPLEYSDISLIDADNPLTSSQIKVSRSLIETVENITEGQWFFLHKVNKKASRIRLAVKLDAAMQLLFINQMGMKVEQFSFDEFAYKLSSKIALPITPAPPFKDITAQLIGKLFTLQENKKLKKRQAKADAEKEQLRQEEERIEARIKAITEATALAEAESEKRELTIQSEASQLTIGCWVQFNNKQGEDIQCRLAARIQSSNSYIFVNRLGLKQEEMEYDELLRRLKNGDARIIKQSNYVDDPLLKVVNDLRKDSL